MLVITRGYVCGTPNRSPNRSQSASPLLSGHVGVHGTCHPGASPKCFSEQAPIENLSHSMHHDANWVILQNYPKLTIHLFHWYALALFGCFSLKSRKKYFLWQTQTNRNCLISWTPKLAQGPTPIHQQDPTFVDVQNVVLFCQETSEKSSLREGSPIFVTRLREFPVGYIYIYYIQYIQQCIFILIFIVAL